MGEGIALTVAAAIGLYWLAGPRRRLQVRQALEDPSPGLLRICRRAGKVAQFGCGVASLVLILAGAFAPGVAWPWAILGAVCFALNALLLIPGRWPRSPR